MTSESRDPSAAPNGSISPASSPPWRAQPHELRQAAGPWSLGDFGYFIAFLAVWLVISILLMFAGYSALKPVMGWKTSLPALQNNAFFALVHQIVFYIPILGYIYGLVVGKYGLRFWSALRWGGLSARLLLRFFLGGVLLALIAAVAPPLLPDRDTFPLEQLFSSPGAAYALAGFAVTIAPFMEELIFRGVLFNIFEQQVGVRFAIVASAALFALFHVLEYWGAWNHLLLVSLVGGAFSLARGLTGSLAPSVILHLAYNASLMTALFFETHHFRAFRGF